MNAPIRQPVPASTKLLMRILERPGLVAAVRELPGAVLGKLIDRIGLEDAGELVALAKTEQLERVFDDDLWRADRAGGDETFRPERFALWLRVMLEAGEEAVVRRLCELPEDLVSLAVHRLVLVVDIDVLEEQLSPGDEEAQALEDALEHSAFEEWEEFRLIARDADAWDDVWIALLALDRDHHDRLRAILERCCEMTLEYISGQGGLYQVLTADEMLDSDVAAAREDRRATEGFISPADARAFLALARRGEGGEERDPITRAYFRGLETNEAAAPVDARPGGEGGAATELTAADAGALAALLQEAEVIAGARPAVALLTGSAEPADSKQGGGHVVAPLFERAMRDLRERAPARFDARVQEVGYLVNVWIAGGAHEGRRPRPSEAMDVVLETCEAGLRARLPAGRDTAAEAVAVLEKTPADVLFRAFMKRAAR
jgi:hypothetical protein